MNRHRQLVRQSPRPTAVDWIIGSACAGILLGLGQLLISVPQDRLPPSLALALIAICAACVMAGACALLMVTRLRDLRLTHSALVGAMLGPLFVFGLSGTALHRVEGPWCWLVAGLGGGVLLLLASLAGAFVATRLKRPRPPSAGLTWGGISLLLAGLALVLFGNRSAVGWFTFALMVVGSVAGAAGLLGLVPRRQTSERGRLVGLLGALILAALAAPFWPWWVPWLLYDQDLPEVQPWPPNILLVVLEARSERSPGSVDATPTLELLALDGVAYRRLEPEPEFDSLLTLPDGSRLAPHLHAAGYVTAGISTDPDRSRGMGVDQLDDRPGGRRMLMESAAWMTGARLLSGPFAGLLSLLDQDHSLRSPEQMVSETARWILEWRTTRAPAPFFLAVDFRASEVHAEAVDAGLQAILDRLEALRLDWVTLLVVAVEQRDSATSERELRAVLVFPPTWEGASRLGIAPRIWGRRLSEAVLGIALSDGRTPVQLPGLSRDLSPPRGLE